MERDNLVGFLVELEEEFVVPIRGNRIDDDLDFNLSSFNVRL